MYEAWRQEQKDWKNQPPKPVHAVFPKSGEAICNTGGWSINPRYGWRELPMPWESVPDSLKCKRCLRGVRKREPTDGEK